MIHIKSRGIPTGGDVSMNVIKDQPNPGPTWLLYHCTAASGHNLQAFSKEKPKSWATSDVISCYLKDGETRPAMKIKKMSRHIAEPQVKQKEGTRQATDFRVFRQNDRQQSLKASVGQHDIFQTASVHSGSSSVKNSNTSQLEMQSIMKLHEHFNLDKSLQKVLSLKAAADDDGFTR